MNKRLHFFVLFLLFTNLTFSQITVTNESFPVLGDTLVTGIDNLPTDIVITAGGGNQQWDFTSLQSPIVFHSVLKSVSEGGAGDYFPNAEFMAESNQSENYFNVTDSKVELLGSFGNELELIDFEVLLYFTPPYVVKRAPMNFLDLNLMNSSFSYAVSSEILPDTIINMLPITIDSLRFRIDIDRTDLIDGWGVVSIPDGEYDVLREKRIEFRDSRIDVKVGNYPWQDITNLLPYENLGLDTVTQYYFVNDVEKEPIAIVTVDNTTNEPVKVEYKSNGIASSVPVYYNEYPDFFVYPNPAINDIRIDFYNLKRGKYHFKIYNILGMSVFEKDFDVTTDLVTYEADISSLRKGTYLYSISDKNGKIIKTKRLLVIRP